MKLFICIALLIVCVAASGGSGHRKHHDIYFITTNKACEAAKGTCFPRSNPKLCSHRTSVTFGHCNRKHSGCCLKRDDICAHFKGKCGVPSTKCTKAKGLHQVPFRCSDKSHCCIPIRKHKKRPHVRTTKQCEAINGKCSKRSNCNMKKSIFVGKCDKAHQRCCINKDKACKNLKGKCLSVKRCRSKKGYHFYRKFTCNGNKGVCCLPKHGRHDKPQ